MRAQQRKRSAALRRECRLGRVTLRPNPPRMITIVLAVALLAIGIAGVFFPSVVDEVIKKAAARGGPHQAAAPVARARRPSSTSPRSPRRCC